MTRSTKTITISIPEGMCADLDHVCSDQGVTPDELALDVLSEYLDAQRKQRWAEIFAYGHERGRASGYGPEDVPRLVEEVRAEMAAERAAEQAERP